MAFCQTTAVTHHLLSNHLTGPIYTLPDDVHLNAWDEVVVATKASAQFYPSYLLKCYLYIFLLSYLTDKATHHYIRHFVILINDH